MRPWQTKADARIIVKVIGGSYPLEEPRSYIKGKVRGYHVQEQGDDGLMHTVACYTEHQLQQAKSHVRELNL